jgi:phosphatidylserine/phosphatidylglycerophosphate/cardiolipin synthase-like enzyme
VVTGSTNLSRPSQSINDENNFCEFMRIFDHHYARYIARAQ